MSFSKIWSEIRIYNILYFCNKRISKRENLSFAFLFFVGILLSLIAAHNLVFIIAIPHIFIVVNLLFPWLFSFCEFTCSASKI